MNIFEKVLTENYLKAYEGSRVVVHDVDILTGMVRRGIMPHSVILGTGSEAQAMEPVISSLGLTVPVHRASEQQVADFLREQTGNRIKPYALSAMFEVPVPLFSEETLSCLQRVVMIKNVTCLHNIANIIDLCIWFGADALLVSGHSKSPFIPQITKLTDFRNFELPVIFFPDDPEEYIPLLHSSGFNVIGLALRNETLEAKDLRNFSSSRTALLLGNESDGLPEEDIDMCGHVVRIPMARGIDSLNVAHACGIALYELTARDFSEKELLL